VLIVDDNSTNRRILEEMLASWHMRPSSVADSASAMTKMRQSLPAEPFHVVICDCQMPDVDGFALARQIKSDEDLEKTPVVMLTSVGRPEDVAKCRRIGLEAILTKPVKHSDLLEAVSSCVGVSIRRPADDPTATSAPAHKTPKRRLRVLVAEDNLVNRKLVTTLLEKRGHQVRSVENGREALAALDGQAKDNFDLVLMDVQMPEMGGLEATRAIRANEGAASPRLPIIALTAHALKGDRERCLDAGMDGYLPKPIDVNQLIAMVEGFARPSGEDPEASDDSTTAVVFDEATALTHTGDDRELLKEIVELFRSDSPASLKAIKQAIDNGDSEALATSAHALKGSIAAIGGTEGHRLARELEGLGRSNRVEDAPRLYAALEKQITLLDEEFVKAGLVERVTRKLRPAAAARKRRRT
jgi:CheY-like chemotaxis protein